jgi:hypothetical protein
MNRPILHVVALVGLLLLAGTALAHVPDFPRDNGSPETALAVPNPSKSWVFYDRVPTDGAAYYSVDLDAGDRLVLSLFTPHSGEFTPSLVLMSPAIEGRNHVPDAVTVPEGYGARVIQGERPDEAEYEPFTPASFYSTVSYDRPVEADGTYLVAVYGADQERGPVGVVVGFEESFSVVEYLTVPIDRHRIHLWEGQSPGLVLGPGLIVLLGGLGALVRRLSGPNLTVRSLVGVAAVLFLAEAAGTVVQTGVALTESGPAFGALLTVAFVVVPAGIGAWLLRRAFDDEFGTPRTADGLAPPLRTRATLVGVGVLGSLTWGGILIGPALAILAAVLPWDRLP